VPKKGFKLTGSVRVASRYLAYPLRSANFVHLHFAGQGLLPLPGNIVIALGLRYDHGIPFGESPVLPKTERFFAGGDTTVRGYEEDRLKTEVVQAELSPYAQGPRVYRLKPQGANIRMLMNLEVMVPIWEVFSMPILGVLFFDAGTLTNALETLVLDDIKTSVGAALRLVTPVGFVSLEYAVPFQPGLGTDPTGRTHFNFGFIF
jgi:outer membrane protein assembly factor BamA